MSAPPPKWQAHTVPGYDAAMTSNCLRLQREIVADASRRQAVLLDPRDLHRELFGTFTPPGFDDYAGTYRGTPKTSLTRRRIAADSQMQPDQEYEFISPHAVPARMIRLMQETRQLVADTSIDDFGKLIALAYTFSWFGKIHPFLDGNGHVQRAIFAAMATEFGYPLSARFVIHPRPYDRLLAMALEIFTRAPDGAENAELGLVAEYLAFFLDGPFNAPRKHVGTASPYV